jgi:ESCRT-II complex subunit VPS22
LHLFITIYSSMRRGLGAAAIVKRRERDARMTELGEQIQEDRAEKAKELLDKFKEKLSEFATNHRSRIRSDAVFREQFVDMCESVGVDPFQSSKSVWSDIFQGVGTYYNDLAIQILTISLMYRETFGALIPMSKCLESIQGSDVTVEDIMRAVKTLEVFGSGAVRTIKVGNEHFISSIPDESNDDLKAILGAFTSCEGLTAEIIAKRLNWSVERVIHGIQTLVKQGVIWIDQCNGVRSYWVFAQWLQV